MKKLFLFSLTAMLILTITLSGCYRGGGGGGTDPSIYTIGGVSFRMINVPSGTFASDDNAIVNAWGPPYGTYFPTSLTVPTAFLCAETEVTYELWCAVYNWATSPDRGAAVYTFAHPCARGYSGSSNQEPVTTINWYDALIWCNALTEYYYGSSANCVYYSDANYTTPIRSYNNTQIDSPYIKAAITGNTDLALCTAQGFRLPANAEWELAARYKDGTNWTPGNYASGATDYAVAAGGYGSHPAPNPNQAPTQAVAVYNTTTTAPVKSKAPNALGLYDMSGNVMEWCFETAPSTYAGGRICRGGAWNTNFNGIQLGAVGANYPGLPDVSTHGSCDIGLRFVKNM